MRWTYRPTKPVAHTRRLRVEVLLTHADSKPERFPSARAVDRLALLPLLQHTRQSLGKTLESFYVFNAVRIDLVFVGAEVTMLTRVTLAGVS